MKKGPAFVTVPDHDSGADCYWPKVLSPGAATSQDGGMHDHALVGCASAVAAEGTGGARNYAPPI